METVVNESKGIEITNFTEFHRNGPISRNTANFMENVMAMKSWIRLVPTYAVCKIL